MFPAPLHPSKLRLLNALVVCLEKRKESSEVVQLARQLRHVCSRLINEHNAGSLVSPTDDYNKAITREICGFPLRQIDVKSRCAYPNDILLLFNMLTEVDDFIGENYYIIN